MSASSVHDCDRGVGYRPEVVYSYVAAGQAHDGYRVAFGDACGTAAQVEAMLRDFEVGSRLAVHVDPTDAANAEVEFGRGDDVDRDFVSIASAAVFTTLATLACAARLRMKD